MRRSARLSNVKNDFIPKEEKISMEGMEGAAQNIYLDSEILALFG